MLQATLKARWDGLAFCQLFVIRTRSCLWGDSYEADQQLLEKTIYSAERIPMQNGFRMHDRRMFEVFAYSTKANDGSSFHQVLRCACAFCIFGPASSGRTGIRTTAFKNWKCQSFFFLIRRSIERNEVKGSSAIQLLSNARPLCLLERAAGRHLQ